MRKLFSLAILILCVAPAGAADKFDPEATAKAIAPLLEAETFAVGRQPFALAVADLTGDGIDDIVTANYADDTVSVLIGTGSGSFQPQEVFQTGDEPSSVVVAATTVPRPSAPPSTPTRSGS